MITIPPRHYVLIANPAVRHDETNEPVMDEHGAITSPTILLRRLPLYPPAQPQIDIEYVLVRPDSAQAWRL